jgi:hypothetical protein
MPVRTERPLLNSWLKSNGDKPAFDVFEQNFPPKHQLGVNQ